MSFRLREIGFFPIRLTLPNWTVGEMSEWFKEHAWKACVQETVPRVRIPLSPPFLSMKEIFTDLKSQLHPVFSLFWLRLKEWLPIAHEHLKGDHEKLNT